MHGLDTSNVSSQVESSRVEPSGIWAYILDRKCSSTWSNVVGRSDHKIAVVNTEFMFQHVYDSLPTSVFDRVGVLLSESLCMRYGYWSQALFSSDEMDFIVRFTCCLQ